MTANIDSFVAGLRPENTVLFLGSGSSIPSGAPSVPALMAMLRTDFSIANETLSLSEISSIVEKNVGRQRLIEKLRELYKKKKSTGGLAIIPLYKWKSIYTTNYDELVEYSYKKYGKTIDVITTDFDFSGRNNSSECTIYKLHGTINKDVADGSLSRIIITEDDYTLTESYRESIYDKFKGDLIGADLVIVGYSLTDSHIKDIVDRALKIRLALGGALGKISVLLFQHDEDRAALLEDKGFEVCFGGVDEFFAALARAKPEAEPDTELCESIVDQYPKVKAVTVDVSHAASQLPSDFSRIFNGNPASYADIAAKVTFDRDVVSKICPGFLTGTVQTAIILGVSGVGKTTAARQVLIRMQEEGWSAWEHSSSFDLDAAGWIKIARDLDTMGQSGVLLIDDAHFQLPKICELTDELERQELKSLRLLLVSARYQWTLRTKSPSLMRIGRDFPMSRLSIGEIERLLRLADTNEVVRPLVEKTFGGYSYSERKRRLTDRCGADMFVCLKNIFATEKFDDIILREYAELEPAYADIYKLVAAMEHAGVRVHRQLVIRLLGIPAQEIGRLLGHLDGIVTEYDISHREGLFGWRVRHTVIAGIIVKYKFHEQSDLRALFERVIEAVSPAFELELRTIREICNTDTGIPSISDLDEQNRLLRRMISRAPGERVPRHRLIRNLIEQGHFDIAEQEIRQFRNDLNPDGPLARYEIKLRLARARNSPGLLEEDRLTLMKQAKDMAVASVQRYNQNRSVHGAFCDVGLEWYRTTGDISVFDLAISTFKAAEARHGDEEMTRMIRQYEGRLAGSLNSFAPVDAPIEDG